MPNGQKNIQILKRRSVFLLLGFVAFLNMGAAKERPEIDKLYCPDKGIKPLGQDYNRGAAVVDQLGFLALPLGLMLAIDDIVRSDALATLPKASVKFTVTGSDGAAIKDAQIAVLRVDENRFLAQIPADGRVVKLPEGEYLFTAVAKTAAPLAKVLWAGKFFTLSAKKATDVALKADHEISQDVPVVLHRAIAAGASLELDLFSGELPHANFIFLKDGKVYSEQSVEHWPVALTIPAQPGDYQLQISPCAPLTGVVSWPVQISPSNIKLNAPEKIPSGAEFDVAWTGDGSQADVIGIRKTGSNLPLVNSLVVGLDVKKVRLTAPIVAGDYDLIYQTAHDTTARSDVSLATRRLKVVAGPIQIVSPSTVNAGEAADFVWPHGPGNTSDYSIWSGDGANATRITTLERPGKVRLLVPPGRYQMRFMEEGTLLAANPISILPSKIFETTLTGLKPGAVLSFPKSVRAGFFDDIALFPAGVPFDGGEMLASAVEVGDHLELELPASAGQFELVLIGKDNLSAPVVLGHAPLTISGVAAAETASQIQIPAAAGPLDRVAVNWKNSQQQVLEIWSAEATKKPKLQRVLLRPDTYSLALPAGNYQLRLRPRTGSDAQARLNQDEDNARVPAPQSTEFTGKLTVTALKIMLDTPTTLPPYTKFTVKTAGKPGFFYKIIIVRAGMKNPDQASISDTRAQDAELEAPFNPGKYELVYLAIADPVATPKVLERVPFTVQ